MMAVSWFFLLIFIYINIVYCFPRDTTVYEFGSKEHPHGGLGWGCCWNNNHPQPYAEPVNETIASMLQFLTPQPLPSAPFPTSAYTVCWNMNIRVFGRGQQMIMRLFHDENVEWSEDKGDFWHQITYSPDRGTLIMIASMVSDKSKKNIPSGGLGVGNYTTDDNPLLRWSAICMANDFLNCRTRYFIGM